MTNHVVLYEPLMPANTGNIARSCAGTDTVLHLIEPLGFRLDDKHMKRAGLDYWDKVDVRKHESLDAFLNTLDENDELYLISKFSSKSYTDVDYTDSNKNYYFIFGKETTGLPETFMRQYYERNLRIPMSDNIRAFNLSNSVAIVLFEALRQQNFPHLEKEHHYPVDKLKD
ncbi:tRNA (uridine(34)/cytosine(34)/5-carboxymethylaminomethyluridine(34)-2'-O)-methyltransferase TrmL [Lactobacillus sp. PV037]|uniref:tRNA (uridine(34)/cytosine(34)/5- carboxymethylaminomethyluridine(34)-2'-O)- methyltransferase TrmL n=1 Tax=unclassified Lactobacillus TaxID=2620435 RepID=UPI00223EE8CA|nr:MULTISPECIES: tRNA (uridine(34)/cytosine(34)/5-carboxymethylaminomethyluridine(34)-2'-O)-methyltransferase TrmL [unclassified Lactobacillus]QNQ82580.1 tRNA (uridine(34)/cytosine(34)/5-carboxymethylaminomethyluridine(34)-2'-O)-methyltransferase TrmL [Lactobacillus sp. PV012]QNQ83305.1 tRNA (uridine(34)/cytosine(34)/5-carboxymethylaminomethyluridine(34)-2'-O)-methyltransferase TrmL [Lactobacillus sp. PV037]